MKSSLPKEESARDRAHRCPRFEARRLTPTIRRETDPTIEYAILSSATSFPCHDIRYPGLSFFTPSASVLMYLVHFMDFTMSSTKQWTNNCVGWVCPYSMIYVSILFYIQTLRAMQTSGAISPSSELYFILTNFTSQYPLENLWVPGPLVQYFKNLSSFLPNETFGNVTPSLPTSPDWNHEGNYALPNPFHLHLPNIPFLISRLRTICTTSLTPKITENLFLSHSNDPCFCANIFSRPCENADGEQRNLISPGAGFILPGDLRLWKNAANKIDGHTLRYDTWTSFMRLDSAFQWMGTLSDMMAKYCRFRRASTPLSDCPPNCSSAGSVICTIVEGSDFFNKVPWTAPNGNGNQVGHYSLQNNRQLFFDATTSIKDLPSNTFYAAMTYNVNTISFLGDRNQQITGNFWNVWPNAHSCTLLLTATDMDTSNPAVFVNAEQLRKYVGRKVRAVIQVIRPDAGGVIGKSTDEQQIVIKGQPPSQLTTFVEVIGIAETSQSIRAEKWTNFGDKFDTHDYNQLCQLANGEYKHLFI